MCGHHRRTSEHRPARSAGRSARPVDPTLRVSDAERDQVADQLRDHAAEGRLSAEELDDRVGRALAATTRGELDALLTDLPGRPSRPRERRRPARAGRELSEFLAVTAVLVTIWLAAGAGYFWPVWVIPFVGLSLFKRARGGGPHWA
jgi:hypothetical protein